MIDRLADMRNLKAQGKTYKEIGAKYGMTAGGAWGLLNPEKKKAHRLLDYAKHREKRCKYIREWKRAKELEDMGGQESNGRAPG